jgi:glycosyltransferase involved in cell wall biosynthesis
MTSPDVFVSVIVPCFNCEARVTPAVEQVISVLQKNYAYYEIILVDDGSFDETSHRVGVMLKKHEGLRLIRLAKRHGVDVAVSAGLDSAIGDYVVVMDPDIDPPAMIPELVMRCHKATGVHYGILSRRARRVHRELLRSPFSFLFDWYCRRFLNINIQRQSGLFRIFSRQSVNIFTQIKDKSRMLRLLTANLGVPIYSFAYEPVSKNHLKGLTPKRSFGDDLDMAFDIMVSTSRHPLRWLSRLGFFLAFLNVIYAGYVVAIFLFKADVSKGWVSLSSQNAFMFFFLFILLTFVSEYIGKMVLETQHKPSYSVLEERNSSVLVDSAKRRNVVSESAKENYL